jgi:hypothetical protein
MSFIHSPKIVTDGLVLSLDAGNVKSYPGSGTVWADKSGRGNNGTLVNGPTFSYGSLGSIVFDGTNDETTFTGVNFGTLTAFTLCGFVKPTLGGSVTGTIANNSNTTSPYGWHCRFENTRGVGFWIGDSGGGVTHYDGISLNDQQWNFFAVTLNPTTITHYKNGIANNTYTGSFNSFVTNNAPFRMCRWEGGEYYYNGSIGSFNYNSKALSAQEITQNFNALRGRFGI